MLLAQSDELKNDPDFKEFLELHREKTKQVWADDAKVEINHACEGPKEEKPRKRHKRSRGKKGSTNTKTKPKELFVHTLKIQGFSEARRKDIKDFFKPLELLSIRLNKRDDVCYVSFKDESDLRFAMKKDRHFWKTSRIKLMRHNIKKCKIFKEAKEEKKKVVQEIFKKYEESMANVEPIEESGRLFIRNLNYSCTNADLEQVFTEYGQINEIHIPIDKQTQKPKGTAYVEFMFPKDAARAYKELNGTKFQDRNFHILPSKPKPDSSNQLSSYQPQFKTPFMPAFKREQTGSNWNMLFLGQNALADVVSDMKGVEKSNLLTQQTHKEPIAVRLALGDAMVVDEMRKFLVSNGIELDSFDNPQAPRSRTVIIAKNLPASTDKSELSSLFESHGRVSRVIMPPNGMSAIIEMEDANEAKSTFRKLSYSKFKDTILYLEWAPINVFREKSLDDQEKTDLKQMKDLQTGTKILVKNIPFEATEGELKKIFASYGELNFVRIPKKIGGQHRGFGFVDFLTKEDALRAFRSLCHSTHLYGRKLVLEWAKVESNE